MDQGEAALRKICAVLNSQRNPSLKIYLRAWVEAWKASGPNLKRLYATLHDPHRTGLMMAMRTLWSPTNTAKAEPLYVPDYLLLERVFGKERTYLDGSGGNPTPEIEALCLFNMLTIIPRCEDLAGPCPRCGKYYLKKRKSQTVYCSRRCGNAVTAVSRNRERIAEKRKEKITLANAGIKSWKLAGANQDWKRWVAAETGIDLRFLTRAINKRDLHPPEEEK